MVSNYSEVITVKVVFEGSLDHTIPSNSSSFTRHCSSVVYRKREANVVVFYPFGPFYSSAAPSPECEASHFTETSNLVLY